MGCVMCDVRRGLDWNVNIGLTAPSRRRRKEVAIDVEANLR
jgi:hypothetical protein